MSNFNLSSGKNRIFKEPRSFGAGLSIFLTGLKFSLSHKSILALSLVPVFVTLVSVFFGFGTVLNFYYTYASSFLVEESAFNFWGGSILLGVSLFFLKVLSGFLAFVTFYIILQIIYIPICALIAERVFVLQGVEDKRTWAQFLKFNLEMFKIGLIKSFLLIFLGLICLVVSLIPGLNFLSFYFALFVLAYDSFDYALELNGLSLSERFKFMRKEFVLINGQMGVLFLFSFIPGLLLMTFPYSVVGATLLIGEANEFKR